MTNWRLIADDLAAELLRGQCRTVHDRGEPCKRCDPLAHYALAAAEAAIVQKPGEPQCLHAYPVVDGKCGGCNQVIS